MANPTLNPKHTVDVKRLVAHRFNGRAELHRKLTRRGHALQKTTVDKWVERNRVPGDWWPELYALCDADGRPLDLTPYLRDGGGDSVTESILD